MNIPKHVGFLQWKSYAIYTGNNRHQSYFSTLEDQVGTDNPARLIDAFIDKLELRKIGLTNTIHKNREAKYFT